MDPLSVWTIAALALGFVVYRVVRRSAQPAQWRSEVRAAWGQPTKIPHRRERWQTALYHDLRTAAAPDENVLDDQTWDDLHLWDVFARVHHTHSVVGEQVLYDRLRTPCAERETLGARDRLAAFFARESEPRESLQVALRALSNDDAAFLPYLFLDELPPRPAYFAVFPALALGVAACAIGGFILPGLWFLLIPLLLVNIIVTPLYRKQIDVWLQPLRALHALLQTGRSLARLAAGHDELAAPHDALRRNLQALAGLNRRAGWLRFEKSETGEVVSILYDYLRMLFLVDINGFVLSLNAIRRNRAALQSVYEIIGDFDAALALASFRSGLPVCATPTFVAAGKTLRVKGLVHPLLSEPVANSLRVEGRSVFVTGSNMSGKTTFIRALAVNVVLAQTLCTCTAQAYEAPFFRVRTSITRADSLAEGKSYYLAEVEAIGAFLEKARQPEPYLFVIDEVFRGTNTVERIAAAKAVLDALNDSTRGHLVLVSTHDLELAEWLTSKWDCYHFRESVDKGELLFDYTIRPGLSSTRNALRLLEASGYPPAVVADASKVADALSRPAPPVLAAKPQR